MPADRPPAAPPDFLALTGHPVRWRLLRELSSSDRQVRELTALVGERQSLTSYHLGLLRRGGLVSARRSSADGRDSYYHLDLAACRERLAVAGSALHPGLGSATGPPAPPASPRGRGRPVRVLFLCTGNSSRSPLAEAILGELGGDAVEVASAGSHPKPLHPETERLLRARGHDLTGRRPQHVDDLLGRRFDRVISLCDRVREVCPELPGARPAHWSLPDPAAADDVPAAFAQVAAELTTRIEFLVHDIHAGTTTEGAQP